MSKKYLTGAVFIAVLLAANCFAQQWRPVSGSRQANISGMALIKHTSATTTFLVVHDNKKKDQEHVGIISITEAAAPKYTPVKWLDGDVPVDLEAASSIPGLANQFIVFNSAGRAFQIVLDTTSNSIKVIKAFDVPMIPKDADFEGFSLQRIDNKLIAVWADRGLTAKPATLFWGEFDVINGKFSNVRTATFLVPFPTENVRHISDIKIDTAGGVFVTSASDPGNDGPFSSAMYFAGVLRPAVDKLFVFIQPDRLTRLYQFDYRKVEAFEFIPGSSGGLAFGTDDENLGAAICLTY